MSKQTADKNKPAIFANYVPDDEQAIDPRGFELDDPSWIPGYSEIIQANEIAAADPLVWANQHAGTGITKEKMYQVIGATPRDVPVTFRWLRVTGPDGGNSYNADEDRAQYVERGYRAVRKQDLENWGLGLPPAAHIGADGMIRRLDTALFVVDGKREKAFQEWQARMTAEAENRVERQGESGVAITSEVLDRGTYEHSFKLTT